jgi:heparan-alpha-glucosaminide N-acetyltransferase
VLVTTCFAYLLLSALYVVVDVKQYWKGQPWFYAGMSIVFLEKVGGTQIANLNICGLK